MSRYSNVRYRTLAEYEQHYLPRIVKEIYKTACDKGWHETDDNRSIVECLMLIVTEAAEATECYRDGEIELTHEDDGKPVGLPSEMADILIRTLDTCQHFGIDICKALVDKMAYNKTRSHRHGGKKI